MRPSRHFPLTVARVPGRRSNDPVVEALRDGEEIVVRLDTIQDGFPGSSSAIYDVVMPDGSVHQVSTTDLGLLGVPYWFNQWPGGPRRGA